MITQSLTNSQPILEPLPLWQMTNLSEHKFAEDIAAKGLYALATFNMCASLLILSYARCLCAAILSHLQFYALELQWQQHKRRPPMSQFTMVTFASYLSFARDSRVGFKRPQRPFEMTHERVRGRERKRSPKQAIK